MKLIESEEELCAWDDYQEFMKIQLKQLESSGEPFFISKQKVEFEIAGKPWNGFAVLAGAKGLISARKLQKEGVIFREGTCKRDGKELSVDGLDPRLVKEAAKTLKKLMLGFKIAGVAEEDSPDAGGADTPGAAPEERLRKLADLKRLENNLGRLLSVLNK